MKIDVVIPTLDNPQLLTHTIATLVGTTQPGIELQFIVVNNGTVEMKPPPEDSEIKPKILNVGSNIGWEGGLSLGLLLSDAPLVLFANDDIHLPISSKGALNTMAAEFDDETVGAVGPSSNCVMGWQSIFGPPFDKETFDVPFLIGFAVLVRRSALDQCGGVATDLPGGDDIDLSIRLRQSGFRLRCCKNVFVFHHGFVTGYRVHGLPNQPNGWNSQEMTKRTWDTLTARHGEDAIREVRMPLEAFHAAAAPVASDHR